MDLDNSNETFIIIGGYIVAMDTTTIQVSRNLLGDLKSRKMYDKESYEDIIRDLLEDTMELSAQTLANIKKLQKLKLG